MSRKNILEPYTIFDAEVMTGTATITSPVTGIKYLDNIAIDLSWTGTPDGTFSVQGSLDGTTWNELGFGTSIVASGAAGNHQIYINQAPFHHLRVAYTNSSGDGELTGKLTAKMV
jgi:hypothetical protein